MTEKIKNSCGRVPVSTTISREEFEEIKANNWHYNELIGLGILGKKNNPAILERISELEAGNKKLSAKLSEFYNKLAAVGKE